MSPSTGCYMSLENKKKIKSSNSIQENNNLQEKNG
jgi:hypothetical protein